MLAWPMLPSQVVKSETLSMCMAGFSYLCSQAIFSFDLALLLLVLEIISPPRNMHRQGTNASTESEKARRRHGQSIVFVRLNQSLSIVDNEELSHVSQGLLRSILHGNLHVLTNDRVSGKLSIASAVEVHEDDTTTEIWTS